MGTFQAARRVQPKLPPRILIVDPTAFVDDWPDRPKEPAAIGLRLISQRDISQARGEAARQALELHPDGDLESQVAAYNDALMGIAVARATTDPNDVTLPFFPLADDNVPMALTPEGIRFVWASVERLHLESSPVVDVATDEDVEDICTRLVQGDLSELSPAAQLRVRRLLSFCLDELGGALDREDDDVVVIRPKADAVADLRLVLAGE